MMIKTEGLIINKEIAVGDELSYKDIETNNCITGEADFLIDKLKISFAKATSSLPNKRYIW